MKTINPFEIKDQQPQAKEELAFTPGMIAQQQRQQTASGPNKLDSTRFCPVDGEQMKRMTAGLRGKHEIPVYVCLQHRVCLPVANEELGPEQQHV